MRLSKILLVLLYNLCITKGFVQEIYPKFRRISFQHNRRYPITRPDFIEKIRNLNSKNVTIRQNSILGLDNNFNDLNDNNSTDIEPIPRIRININKNTTFTL